MENYKIRRFVLLWICVYCAGMACLADTVRERAYLRTDKRFYLSGELIWIKFLVTDSEGRPSSLSKVGYVELLDSTAAVIHAKLELTEGRGEGYMELPVTLPTGNYRMVGYTRYMGNEGEKVFFETPLSVVNTFVADETLEVDSVLPSYTFVKCANSINLSPGQAEYPTRTEGEIRLSSLPTDVHTLSVSIAGVDLYSPAAESGIGEWLGGLRSLSGIPFSGTVIPEYEGLIISGKMVDINTDSPAFEEGARALLGFTGNDIRLFGGQFNGKGEVTFFTRHVSGRHEVATTVFSLSDGRYRIDIKEPFLSHTPKVMPGLRLNPSWQEVLERRSVGLQVAHIYTADSMSRLEVGKPWFQRLPDRSYLLDEYTRFTTMEEVIVEFIPSLRFRRLVGNRRLSVLTEERIGYAEGNSLILLDGIPISDHENIFRYDPLKVKKVDVYKGRQVFGGQIYDGVAVFNTYNSDYLGLTVDKSTQFFDYEGTLAHRVFYMPTYQTDIERRSPVPDFRHTLLWMPEVVVGGQSSVTIPFTTSDIIGDFVITVEGLTKEGKPVYATEQFRVK